MDRAFQEPSSQEKVLSQKKMELDIEAVSVSTEIVARKRKEREKEMFIKFMASTTLTDLLKIVATHGLPPTLKEDAEVGTRKIMASMLSGVPSTSS